MRGSHRYCMTRWLAATILLASCSGANPAGSSSSVQSIEASLQMENGGLTMTNEAPGFGTAVLDLNDLDPNLSLPPAPPPDPKEGKVPPPPGLPPPPPCPHGLLAGAWIDMGDGFGVFDGKWAKEDGKIIGHLKGIFGTDPQGQGLFFGKYIDAAGKFMGLVKGHYDQGLLEGRWFDQNGLQGALDGVSIGGGFKGMWTAFCPMCNVQCMPGFVRPPGGECFCVPAQVKPCVQGQCPPDMTCDPCPPLCKPGDACPPVCGPPVCVPKPPLPPPSAPQGQPAPPASPSGSQGNAADIE